MRTGKELILATKPYAVDFPARLNSRIPFYRLPEACRAMPELRPARTTSLHPRDIFNCLRLKVWCVESQRLVGIHSL